MQKKAIILDLDNTIYPVHSIGDKLFKPLFALIEESGAYKGDMQEIKRQVMRQPFQKVAKDFSFSQHLTESGLELLSGLSYDDKMETFEDYQFVKALPGKKYLVTTGFAKLQNSKIEQLHIRGDFENIFVIDPSTSALTKKDIFKQILTDNQLEPKEALVVGDDAESEIKAGKELGMVVVLYNHKGEQPEAKGQETIHSFQELRRYVEE